MFSKSTVYHINFTCIYRTKLTNVVNRERSVHVYLMYIFEDQMSMFEYLKILEKISSLVSSLLYRVGNLAFLQPNNSILALLFCLVGHWS